MWLENDRTNEDPDGETVEQYRAAEAAAGDSPMTQGELPPAPAQLILTRLDELHELFRRRLLDDRTKTDFVAELKERSEIDDRILQTRLLRPLAMRVIGVVDRVDAWDGEPDPLAASVAEELIDVLEEFGIETVSTDGMVDPLIHRVAAIHPDNSPRGTILSVRQRGLTLDGRVIRPADVVVSGGGDPAKGAE